MAMLSNKNGILRQTPESAELREFFQLKVGYELPIHVNMFHVDGRLIVLPELPSTKEH